MHGIDIIMVTNRYYYDYKNKIRGFLSTFTI